MVKKGKGTYIQATKGNDRSGGWKQPKKVRIPEAPYKSNLMKNLKFFSWSLSLQLVVVSILAYFLEMKSQLISALVLASVLISAYLTALKK